MQSLRPGRMLGRGLLALAASPLVLACSGSGSRFPSRAGEPPCDVEVQGFSVLSATCIATTSARITGLAPDTSGGVFVTGTFAGWFFLDVKHPLSTDGSLQGFVGAFDASLSPRFVRAVDAPGSIRGIAAGPRGVALVSSSTNAAEGPFLTRIDAGSGDITFRRDLGSGGLVGSVVYDPRGGLLMTSQRDGLRVSVTNEEGQALVSQQVGEPFAPVIAPSVAEGAFVAEVAPVADGFVVAHARASGDGASPSDRVLSKIATNGAVVWTRPAPIGARAQVAPHGDGVVVLSPDASSTCQGARSFSVTGFDREAGVRFTRCFAVDARKLRLAVDRRGHVFVSGQAHGQVDLGSGVHDAGVIGKGLASFVVELGAGGNVERTGWIGGARYVANEALTVTSDGAIAIAGLAGSTASASTVYLARLRN